MLKPFLDVCIQISEKMRHAYFQGYFIGPLQSDFIEAILLPSKLFENLPHLDFYESKKWFLVNVDDLCPKDEKLIDAFSTMFLAFLDL